MTSSPVLEGTWEELKLHDEELAGKRFRLVPLPSATGSATAGRSGSRSGMPSKTTARPPRQLTGMGKFAGIIPSSEEFMRQKQEEIELERRKLRG